VPGSALACAAGAGWAAAGWHRRANRGMQRQRWGATRGWHSGQRHSGRTQWAGWAGF